MKSINEVELVTIKNKADEECHQYADQFMQKRIRFQKRISQFVGG